MWNFQWWPWILGTPQQWSLMFCNLCLWRGYLISSFCTMKKAILSLACTSLSVAINFWEVTPWSVLVIHQKDSAKPTSLKCVAERDREPEVMELGLLTKLVCFPVQPNGFFSCQKLVQLNPIALIII